VLASEKADAAMRIFNADGSEAAMCGNGIRCVVDYLQRKKGAPKVLSIETGRGVLACKREGAEICVDLGAPERLHWPIELEGREVFVVNTGVPHAVVFVENLEAVNLMKWGPSIRFHERFTPEGVNVNFAVMTVDGNVAVRTYERGVEGETLACGTGAAAAAFVARERWGIQDAVTVLTRTSFSQSTFRPLLKFFFPKTNSEVHAMQMRGGADLVFEGHFDRSSVQ
jgi:diaminopimelate epimerase